MDVSEYLSNLPERFHVGVNIRTAAGEGLKQSGVAKVPEAPGMEIRFPAGTLPEPKQIDMESDCLVFIETGEIVTLICTIESVAGRELLIVSVREMIQHVEKREFFRGAADRLSIAWRGKNAPAGNRDNQARGVNVSCGGLLMTTGQKPEKRQKLLLDIYLPEPVRKTIKCDAVVLRVSQRNANTFFVAVKFDNLDSDLCDDIMAYCFAEQRRRLREQVVTKDL